MKDFFKQNGLYLLVYACILIYLATVLLSEGKVQIHQHINTFVGNPIIDIFNKYITHLGDGVFAILISLVAICINVRKGLYMILSYITASILTTILKTFVFVNIWRPSFVFQYFVREDLQVVNGVDLNIGNSFPSGHATAAFAIFMSLLFISKHHGYKVLFFTLALLASYSRTYLSQHWLIDIYVGSIIGTSFSLLMYVVFYKNNKTLQFDESLSVLISRKKTRV